MEKCVNLLLLEHYKIALHRRLISELPGVHSLFLMHMSKHHLHYYQGDNICQYKVYDQNLLNYNFLISVPVSIIPFRMSNISWELNFKIHRLCFIYKIPKACSTYINVIISHTAGKRLNTFTYLYIFKATMLLIALNLVLQLHPYSFTCGDTYCAEQEKKRFHIFSQHFNF